MRTVSNLWPRKTSLRECVGEPPTLMLRKYKEDGVTFKTQGRE